MGAALRWVSIGLFLLVCAFFIAFGVLYASVEDLLWFHAAAVPSLALSDIRPLYFALMKLIGGAAIALGLLGSYVVLGPIRKGQTIAAAALSVAFSVPLLMAAYVAETLAATTGAPTAWHNMGVLLAVTASAWAAHTLSHRRNPKVAHHG